jgi:tetratricopeptide (TPR) repeat protein
MSLIARLFNGGGSELDRREFMEEGLTDALVTLGFSIGLKAKDASAETSSVDDLIKEADGLFMADKYKEAIPLYQSAIKQGGRLDNQKKAELYFKIGFSYGELREWEKGLDAYREGMKFNPEIRTTSPHYKSKEARDFINEGIKYKKSDMSKSLDFLNKAESLEPDNPAARYHMGWTYFFNKDSISAINEFKKSIKKDPFFSSPIAGLGKQFYESRNSKECIFFYNVLLTMDPTTKYKETFNNRIQEMKKI